MSEKSQIVENISETYDDLPYSSKPFAQTHPSFLRAVGALFNVKTPSIDTANILEIGCSFGGNILPLAVQYPNANILGLDLSGKQISIGKSVIELMELTNIQLQQQDITTYNPPAKHFDYIICHGVYSWVPNSVRDAILRVIAEGLSDDGAAIVSYNTYPGWKMKEVYRDTMLYRSQEIKDVREKIKYGFGMMDFLKKHLAANNPWRVAIDQHYDHIRQADLSYLAHEYFEVINEPCYFHEFMSLAKEKGLGFVSEADFQNHFYSPVNLDKEAQQALLREANGDIVKLEQLNDFLSNRTFRQTILVRGENKQTANINGVTLQHDVLSELFIQGTFYKETDESTNEVQWKSVQNPDGTAFKDIPAVSHILTLLNEQNGQTLQVKAIWQDLQKKSSTTSRADFFNAIAELIIRRQVKLRADPVCWGSVDLEKPHMLAAYRKLFQWSKNHPETIGLNTAFHEPIHTDVIADELVQFLDGKHTREALCEKLLEAASAQRITFHNSEEAIISDDKALRIAAEEHTDGLLNVLHFNGLLT